MEVAARRRRRVDRLADDAGGRECLPGAALERRRHQVIDLIRHVERVEHRVPSMGDGVDAKNGIPLDRPDETREVAEPALVLGPSGRQQFAFEHDLGVGRNFKIDGLAFDEFDRRAGEPAGQLEFVEARRRHMGGRHHDRGVGPDRDRERQPAALAECAVIEQLQVAGADEIDAGLAPGADHQPISTGVAAVLRVPGNANTGGDIGAAVEIADQRHRQRREIDVVTLEDDVAHRPGVHHHGGLAFADPLDEGLADVAVMAVERRPHAGARTDNAGDDANVIAAHPRKPQRRLRRPDARREVAQVDFIGDPLQFADRDQLFQIIPEPCRHVAHLHKYRGEEYTPRPDIPCTGKLAVDAAVRQPFSLLLHSL